MADRRSKGLVLSRVPPLHACRTPPVGRIGRSRKNLSRSIIMVSSSEKRQGPSGEKLHSRGLCRSGAVLGRRSCRAASRERGKDLPVDDRAVTVSLAGSPGPAIFALSFISAVRSFSTGSAIKASTFAGSIASTSMRRAALSASRSAGGTVTPLWRMPCERALWPRHRKEASDAHTTCGFPKTVTLAGSPRRLRYCREPIGVQILGRGGLIARCRNPPLVALPKLRKPKTRGDS